MRKALQLILTLMLPAAAALAVTYPNVNAGFQQFDLQNVGTLVFRQPVDDAETQTPSARVKLLEHQRCWAR